MIRRLACCLFVVGVAFGQAVSLAQDQVTCPELEEGIRQVREAEFDAAVVTLDRLARRLDEQGGQSKLLGRTYVYLSVAYLGLSQVERAKTKFLEALEADEALAISPSEFPPKYLEFFQEAREDAAATQTASVAPPPTVGERSGSAGTTGAEPAATEAPPTPTEPPSETEETTGAEPVPVTTGAAAEEPTPTQDTTRASKGHSRTLLILGGVGAAGAVAVAAGGGGGSGSGSPATSSTPTPTPAPTPAPVAEAPTFDFSLSLDPPPGSTIRVSRNLAVRADLSLNLAFSCDQNLSGITIEAALLRDDGYIIGYWRSLDQSCPAGQGTSATVDGLGMFQTSFIPGEGTWVDVRASHPTSGELRPAGEHLVRLAEPYFFVWE